MSNTKRNIDGMEIILAPITVPAFTDGSGYYLRHAEIKAEGLTGLRVRPIILGYYFLDQASIDIHCHYDDPVFSAERFGDVYTNDRFEEEVNKLVKPILDIERLPDFGYTEQGMQTDDYISMEAGTAWSDYFATISNHALLALTGRQGIEAISLGDFHWARDKD